MGDPHASRNASRPYGFGPGWTLSRTTENNSQRALFCAAVDGGFPAGHRETNDTCNGSGRNTLNGLVFRPMGTVDWNSALFRGVSGETSRARISGDGQAGAVRSR